MNTVHVRWRTFLARTQSSFDELLWDRRTLCLAALDFDTYDTSSLSTRWSATRSDVFALIERVASTWSQSIEPAFIAAGVNGQPLLDEETLGRRLCIQLTHDFDRLEIEVFGEAAEKLVYAARSSLVRRLRCPRCERPLPAPDCLFRPREVTCSNCDASHRIEPSEAFKVLEHFAVHHLSEREAIEAWEALRKAERARRELRVNTPQVEAEVQRASSRYWQHYLMARAKLVPELERDFEKDLAARMR